VVVLRLERTSFILEYEAYSTLCGRNLLVFKKILNY
jgi:hypothetical protein